MFTLTAAAAARIRQAAVEGGMADLALRVAARQEADGSITYGMGFDEPGEGEQPSLQAEGVTVLIAGSSQPLLQDTLLDFVELEPGRVQLHLRAARRRAARRGRLRQLQQRRLRLARQRLLSGSTSTLPGAPAMNACVDCPPPCCALRARRAPARSTWSAPARATRSC